MGLDLLINQFGAIIGLLIFIALAAGGLFGYVVRSRTDANSFVQKTDSSTEKTYADALLLLARNGDTANQIQRDMVTSTKEVAAEMRGMLSMLDANTKATRAASMSIDDINGQIPGIRENAAQIPGIRDNVQAIQTVTATLETNLGESIKDQLAPAVTVLMSIDKQLTSLVADSLDRDGRTNNTLIELMTVVKEVRTDFLQRIERFILRDINQFLPPDAPVIPATQDNHIEENKENQPS
jgi:uncharacterized protein YeeX (DUF496 family)